jgi:hypothetical protein
VFLSGSQAGQALRVYFNERRLAVFPRHRLCRGVLILPPHHGEYLRGRRRQALRTNLSRAATAGIRCEILDDPSIAHDVAFEVLSRRATRADGNDEVWRARITHPGLTFLAAFDEHGDPLAVSGAVIDDSVCLIKFAVAGDHQARWALHDHLVRILIARGVTYLLAQGGGPFGALGFASNVQHYQHLLGYELRHVIPARTHAIGRRRLLASVAVVAVAIATIIVPRATASTNAHPLAPALRLSSYQFVLAVPRRPILPRSPGIRGGRHLPDQPR